MVPIPKEELIDKAYYQGESAETYIARWNLELNVFQYIYDNTIKSVPYYTLETETDAFAPILNIDRINIDAIKNGLYVKK